MQGARPGGAEPLPAAHLVSLRSRLCLCRRCGCCTCCSCRCCCGLRRGLWQGRNRHLAPGRRRGAGCCAGGRRLPSSNLVGGRWRLIGCLRLAALAFVRGAGRAAGPGVLLAGLAPQGRQRALGIGCGRRLLCDGLEHGCRAGGEPGGGGRHSKLHARCWGYETCKKELFNNRRTVQCASTSAASRSGPTFNFQDAELAPTMSVSNLCRFCSIVWIAA